MKSVPADRWDRERPQGGTGLRGAETGKRRTRPGSEKTGLIIHKTGSKLLLSRDLSLFEKRKEFFWTAVEGSGTKGLDT